jgi:hypothetical protein
VPLVDLAHLDPRIPAFGGQAAPVSERPSFIERTPGRATVG